MRWIVRNQDGNGEIQTMIALLVLAGLVGVRSMSASCAISLEVNQSVQIVESFILLAHGRLVITIPRSLDH